AYRGSSVWWRSARSLGISPAIPAAVLPKTETGSYNRNGVGSAVLPRMRPMVWIWAGVLAACGVAAWLILRQPVRHVLEDLNIDGARDQFRRQREWLEARFLGALAKADPVERRRWEEAHWHDEIVWARDRQTRRLLALAGVHFESESMSEFPGYPPRHATA